MLRFLSLLALTSALIAQNPFADHINRGKDLLAARDFTNARKEFWAARGEAANEKQNAVAAWRIAQSYRDEGNIDSAIDWYKQSLQYLPSDQAQKEMMELELKRVGKQVDSSEIKHALTLAPADRSPVAEENTIDLDILFDFDKSSLKAEGRAQVHELAVALSSDDLKNKVFAITGHTDLIGKPEYNMTLSTQRAQVVCDALLAQSGLSKNQLQCQGKGMTAPKYRDTSDQASRLNRRVQVTVRN